MSATTRIGQGWILAIDILTFSYVLPTIGGARDFHALDLAYAGHTITSHHLLVEVDGR